MGKMKDFLQVRLAMEHNDTIRRIVLEHYPAVEAIYVFGSHAAGNPRPGGDIDIALLLPHRQAREVTGLGFGACWFELAEALQMPVDLLNARRVSTVFQKEIIRGEMIFCADRTAADEFEMMTLSYYQKLNYERRGILAEFKKTGRAYPV
jgi:predicted nucleotidyltransferase